MIDFVNVNKVYPNGTVALDNINIHIEDGEFVFIVGHSGAGKSTLLKLLLREEKATSGKIIVRTKKQTDTGDGPVKTFNLTRMSFMRVAQYRRRLGIVFQDYRLFEKKTVFENVAFAMQVIGTPDDVIKKRVPAILLTLKIQDKIHCFPKELSGGEQQRVALARALANNPQIIFADEPTANIDEKLGEDMLVLLERINQKFNKTIIVITHDMNLVKAGNHRVIVLDHGTVAKDGLAGEDVHE